MSVRKEIPLLLATLVAACALVTLTGVPVTHNALLPFVKGASMLKSFAVANGATAEFDTQIRAMFDAIDASDFASPQEQAAHTALFDLIRGGVETAATAHGVEIPTTLDAARRIMDTARETALLALADLHGAETSGAVPAYMM